MAAGGLQEIRLIAIGKTGSGKSASGNTIMGDEKFREVRGWSSGTEKCDWKQGQLNGYNVQFTDTPGVCDTDKTQDFIHREIAKSVATVTPGPHAVLMVFKAGDRFTKEEQEAYEELKRLFGQELTKFMIVIFTGMDALEQDGVQLSVAITKAPQKVREIVQEASNRFVGFNNKADWTTRKSQGAQLLKMVADLIAANGGQCYTNDLVKKIDDEVKKEMAGKTSRETVKKEIIEEKREGFFKRAWKYITSKVCAVM